MWSQWVPLYAAYSSAVITRLPEAEAPTDNEAVIKALRELAGENGGYIPVDEGPRGTEVTAEDGTAD